MSGTNWLDLSLSSNRHIRTYVQGFVDISGGNLIVRNNNLFVYGGDSSLNGRLLVSGDSSLNGNLTIGSTLYPMGGINLQNNLNMGGLINQSGTTVQGGVIYQPIVTSDVSAIINASTLYVNNMIGDGNNFIIGNTDTSITVGVNNNQVEIGGPLYAAYDTSINGNLFVNNNAFFDSNVFIGGDASLNIRLFVGGDASLNSRLFVGGDASLNSRLFVGGNTSLNGGLFLGGDASLNGNLSIGKDLNINGNLSVKQYKTNLTVYTIDYQLMVAQDLSVNGHLFITGDSSMNKRLFVGSDASFGGNVSIKGNIDTPGQYNYNGHNSDNPPGAISAYLGTSDPDGWVICDGIQRTNGMDGRYNRLITANIGSGTANSTYTPPNLTGKFLYGTTTTSSVNTTGGANSVTLSSANLPPHNHSGTTALTNTDHTHTFRVESSKDDFNFTSSDRAAGSDTAPGAVTSYPATGGMSANATHAHTFTTDNGPGTSTAFSILPSYTTVNYIIKY